MHRDGVESSHLKSVGHEGVVMEVEFKDGVIWRYEVTEEEWAGFPEAESKGRYFPLYIRPLGGVRVDLS